LTDCLQALSVPYAVVFETKPIAFALRDVVPGTALASVAQPGIEIHEDIGLVDPEESLPEEPEV
jgi:hypothetical protein